MLEGNVISRVCLFMAGSRVTITYDALEFTKQGPPQPSSPPDMGPHCTGSPEHLQSRLTWSSMYMDPQVVTSGGQDWRPIQTCSPEDPLPPGLSGGY